ncbi:MAG: tetratricopeptide repeat protein [candidate division KSB1 bacterium]|nr:tetratricopeptide repeat protein [candidate division KSB1 bacterium]
MKTQYLQYPEAVKKLFIAYLILIANTGYLMAFSHENWFYAANIVLHLLLGAVVILPFMKWARLFLRYDAHHGKPFGRNAGRLGYGFMILAALTGVVLAFHSMFRAQSWLLIFHAILGVLACLFMISSIRRAGYNISVDNVYSRAGRWGLVVFISSGVFVLITHGLRTVFPNRNHVIENNVMMPVDLKQGAMKNSEGPFYPSPLETSNENYLNHDFLLNSQSCGTAGCHPDIVQQWQASGHRMASIGNERYRKALRYLEKRVDKNVLNFCAGCHSPALLVSGLSTESINDLVTQNIDDPGVGCNACHAVRKIKSTAGNADMQLHRPGLTSLGVSEVGWQRWLYGWIINVMPDMHRNSMMQPFHREQSSEFCSTCHEVGLEPPLLQQGWASGPNHYDSWRLSSFGGSPVLSFFDRDKKQSCVDCHMPLVSSNDAGNDNGLVRDHRFLRPGGSTVAASEPFVELHAFLLPAGSDGLGALPAIAMPAAGDRNRSQPGPAAELSLDVVIAPTGVGHFMPFGKFETRRLGLKVELFNTAGVRLWQQAVDDLKAHEDISEDDMPKMVFSQKFNKEDAALPILQIIPADAARLVRLNLPLSELVGQQLRLSLKLIEQRHHVDLVSDGAEPHATVLANTDVGLVRQHGQWNIHTTANAEQWNRYGAALYLQNEFRRARRAFQQAARLNPEEIQYRINIARTWLATSQPDSAKILLAQILKQDRRNPKANFFLSQCIKLEKDYQRALKYLRRARRQYKEDVFLMLAEGEIYFLMQAYKKAIRVLRRVILRHPENAVAHYYRMQANRKLGRFDKASYEAKLYRKFAVRKFEAQPLFSFIGYDSVMPPIFQHFLMPENEE